MYEYWENNSTGNLWRAYIVIFEEGKFQQKADSPKSVEEEKQRKRKAECHLGRTNVHT